MTKIDFTKPVQTKDGRPVRILCTDLKCNDPHQVVGLMKFYGKEDLYTWDLNGRFCKGYIHFLDLINVPEKKTIYQLTVRDKTGIQEVTFEVPND